MEDIFLKENETLEDLQYNNLKIIQNKNLYRFTSDAVILSNFIKAKSSDVLVDLGAGSGIISILATCKNNLKHTVGIEIQKELFDMANRSIKFNNLQSRINMINMDMKNLNNYKVRKNLGLCDVDVVVSNPPYKKEGNKKLNLEQSVRIARHEICINMKDLFHTANTLLKFGGKFFVVYDANRLAEIMFELKTNNLEPKRMFLTQSSSDKEPILVFIEAIKGGKEGIRILPNLITNDKNGLYLEEVKKLKFNY